MKVSKPYNFIWPASTSNPQGESIIDLYNCVNKEDTIIGYSREIAPSEGKLIIKKLNDDLLNKHRKLFLVLCDSQIVGMAILTPDTQPICKHIVELSKGIIHPSHRGHGLLRNAFLEIAKYCRDQNYGRIILDVREGSAAHTLWKYLGFQEYGRLEDYARIKGKSYPGVYMHQSTSDLLLKLQSHT